MFITEPHKSIQGALYSEYMYDAAMDQLKRSLTVGFSGSRGSVQNGHRDVHSLDK
jgi:hypothetical protein